MSYVTIAAAIENYIAPALADFAGDYDLDAIAHKVAIFQPELREYTIDEDIFWDVVAEYDLTGA